MWSWFVLIVFLLIVPSAYAYNFKCQSRNGWAPGNGRYSYQGEWVDYFKVYAKAGDMCCFITPKERRDIGSLEINVTKFNS